MVRIYTLTLAPSLDSATITPQIYPEGKLRCTSPVFEPGGGGINVARAIAHLAEPQRRFSPQGEQPESILLHCSPTKMFLYPPSKPKTGPDKIYMSTLSPAANSTVLSCLALRWPMTSSTNFRIRCWKLNLARCWSSAVVCRPAYSLRS